jgi:hypothetical protein
MEEVKHAGEENNTHVQRPCGTAGVEAPGGIFKYSATQRPTDMF